MFDWDDMRHFLALAESGTLSGAARQLKVDHATVARHITGLERALDETLVDRFSKRWRLTDVGRDVARMAEGMQAQAHSVERAVRARHADSPALVTISAPPALASYFLAPRLAELRLLHPELEFSLLGSQAVASLSRQEADIAVRLFRPTEVSSVARRIGRVVYGLCAAPAYPQKPPAEWQFIAYDSALDHVPEQEWLRTFADGRRIVFRSNDLASQLAAARAGIGVAALPRFLVEGDVQVTTLPVEGMPLSRDIHLVVHADMQRNPAVRTVMTFITDKVASDLPRPDR
ncbi:LysR family transcriptional regulator [Rhizobium leguminosarum]|uniref:LysR family transcriptional regulator n=1 Tax=Rhizobium leguminosarum TaxID=384 RepID=UPI0024B38830|nr:LysR family transcriptional regulator [Rhizobium leguminosarum]WHO83564.1 LysR family transcriptional regulator [Rhizobium leguminosarum]